jgi:hypothetical protein
LNDFLKIERHKEDQNVQTTSIAKYAIPKCVRILNLGTRWRKVTSFTPRPLYPGERTPGRHWVEDWMDFEACLGRGGEQKIIIIPSLTSPGMEWSSNP